LAASGGNGSIAMMKMRILALYVAAAGALVALPPSAHAQPGQGQQRGGPPPGYGGPPPGYGGPPPGYGGQPGYNNPRRMDGGGDQQRRDEYRQRDMERRQQWMSPDDRRDLRRDIRDHGRDVYRNPNR
jgi:hypothetical protein